MKGVWFCLLLGVLVLSAGCHSFNHDWKAAGSKLIWPGSLEGRWQGVWVSDVSGHTDKLRCVIAPETNGTYRARFHAKYRKILSFAYTVPLKVDPTTNGFAFSGQADLGWMAGGLYHYDGETDGTNFHSNYSCKYDHGRFVMGRP